MEKHLSAYHQLLKQKMDNYKSRIRPTLETGSVVTDTRSNVQYVVTEYGKVNLKGKSGWERAEALISIASSSNLEKSLRSC